MSGEVIAVLCAWPPWTALLAGWAIWLYRKPIAARIGQGWTFKLPGGVEASALPQQAERQAEPAPIAQRLEAGAERPALPGADPRQVADRILDGLIDGYLLEQEERLKEELNTSGLIQAPEQAVRVLVRYTAASFVEQDFERIFGVVYGSQVRLLRRLNESEATRDEARQFYDAAVGVWPGLEQYPFETYMNFLTTQRLVVVTAQSRIAITMKGRAFLSFLVRQGKLERPF